MQDDILPAKQVLKDSLPLSLAAHLAGWWGDGRQGMEAAKPPSSASMAAGLPRASWPLGFLAGHRALGGHWREQVGGQPTL